MTIKKFPIENIESWFFYNLDITTLPDWYEENSSTAKRLERIAQILTRQGRFNEYLKEDINNLWIKSASLEDFINSVKNLLEEKVEELNDRIDGVNNTLELVSTDVDTLKDDVTDIKNVNNSQNLRLTSAENEIIAHNAIIGLLQEDINENSLTVNVLENSVNSLTTRVNILENDVENLEESSVKQGNEISNHESRIEFLEASSGGGVYFNHFTSWEDGNESFPDMPFYETIGKTTSGRKVIAAYIPVLHAIATNNETHNRAVLLPEVSIDNTSTPEVYEVGIHYMRRTNTVSGDIFFSGKTPIDFTLRHITGDNFNLNIVFNNGTNKDFNTLILFKITYIEKNLEEIEEEE